jgi:isocitrate dehydrogenase kinase/phosphatase
MSLHLARERLAHRGAEVILEDYHEYVADFHEVTRRARACFERRDWHGMQRDAAERLDLYGRVIDRTVAEIRNTLLGSAQDLALWAAMRAALAGMIAGDPDIELVETFFNSITRRIFTTVGVDPRIEFLSSGLDARPPTEGPVLVTHDRVRPVMDAVRAILTGCGFAAPFEDLDRDVELVARMIHREQRVLGPMPSIDAIDMVRWVFYRNKGAYLVGRIRAGDEAIPLTIALHHEERGIFVDAVLLSAEEVGIVFSFTRSYLHVDVDRAYDLVQFLKSIMPGKPVSEIYTAIGFHKHGKTELYRDLIRHIKTSTEPFEVAQGERGMVMIVFTLPSFDVVFKVIRDTFDYPKTTTRRDVMENYHLVFKHDRAGRLADVQEFEHLAFPRERFSEGLLAELATAAAQTVRIQDGMVQFDHLYTERRMTPLNLYLREVDDAAARRAVLDYGQAIRDLAATNIFPGDMLLKNFGVTRHRRVVFYDYDELCPVTTCNFREMPAARDMDDELGSEPWFYVGPHDIFPEEFLTFMGLAGTTRDAFLRAHHELLTAQYWRAMQARLRAGEIMDIIPYSPGRRLKYMDTIPYRPSRRIAPG